MRGIVFIWTFVKNKPSCEAMGLGSLYFAATTLIRFQLTGVLPPAFRLW